MMIAGRTIDRRVIRCLTAVLEGKILLELMSSRLAGRHSLVCEGLGALYGIGANPKLGLPDEYVSKQDPNWGPHDIDWAGAVVTFSKLDSKLLS